MAQLNDPQKLFAYKLGTALSSEKKILSMLKKLEQRANRDELKQQFRHHRDETEGQIKNIEQAFQALGKEPEPQPCPAIEGIEKEGQSMLKMADEPLVDAVILGGAAATEHHEIAVYEGLITKAEAMGEQDVVALLQENLENEEATLRKARLTSQQLAQRAATAV